MKRSDESILETLKMLVDRNIDGISFTPEGKRGEVRIDGLNLSEKGTFISNKLGNMYEILTYKMGKDGNVSDIERFEGILSGPEVYINNLIKCGFNGLAVKKTKENHSNEYIDHIYEKLCQLVK